MNKFKEASKPEATEAKPESKVARSVAEVVSGSFLTKEKTLQHLPFIFFLSLLGIIYIAVGYSAEEKIRQLNKITNELKELRSEYITTKSDLMFISKQSEVAKAVEYTGLKESVEPPQKILINDSTHLSTN